MEKIKNPENTTFHPVKFEFRTWIFFLIKEHQKKRTMSSGEAENKSFRDIKV